MHKCILHSEISAYICPAIQKQVSIVKGKTARQQSIRDIILACNVSTQDDLLRMLAGRGFHPTQGTLSRDLRDLRIVKQHTEDGQYRYILPHSNRPADFHFELSDSSLAFSGHLAVLKTRPGYAAMLASLIDDAHNDLFLGTVAGDDTVLLVLREQVTHSQAREQLLLILQHIKEA